MPARVHPALPAKEMFGDLLRQPIIPAHRPRRLTGRFGAGTNGGSGAPKPEQILWDVREQAA
jgi:hypothetical protein